MRFGIAWFWFLALSESLGCGGRTGDEVDEPGALGCELRCEARVEQCGFYNEDCTNECIHNLKLLDSSKGCGQAHDRLIECQLEFGHAVCEVGGALSMPDECYDEMLAFNAICE